MNKEYKYLKVINKSKDLTLWFGNYGSASGINPGTTRDIPFYIDAAKDLFIESTKTTTDKNGKTKKETSIRGFFEFDAPTAGTLTFNGKTAVFDQPVTTKGEQPFVVGAPSVIADLNFDTMLAIPKSKLDGGGDLDKVLLDGLYTDYLFKTEGDILHVGDRLLKNVELLQFLGDNSIFAYSHTLKLMIPVIGSGILIDTGGVKLGPIPKPTPAPEPKPTPKPEPEPTPEPKPKGGGLILKVIKFFQS